KSNAPALVYEEGSLIKRVIRDLYSKDISEVIVDGENGYRDAKDFMRMLMPSHAKNVKPYKEALPLFQRFQVEAQLDAMFSPIGKISQFGLLEMSRQRLRAGVLAGSTVTCPHCNGQGIIRSTESAALRLLRALDEEGQRQPAANVTVKAPPDVTIYALNQKRR